MIIKKSFKKHIIEAVISVKDKIDKDPFQRRDLTEMALDVGLGRNNLQRGFKELFGTSIKDYAFRKRMEVAKNMLEEGNLSRKEIAFKCGYRCPCNFSNSFKNVYGLSPLEFKNKFAIGNISLMYDCN